MFHFDVDSLKYEVYIMDCFIQRCLCSGNGLQQMLECKSFEINAYSMSIVCSVNAQWK